MICKPKNLRIIINLYKVLKELSLYPCLEVIEKEGTLQFIRLKHQRIMFKEA